MLYDQLTEFDASRILDIPEKPVAVGEVTETTMLLAEAKSKRLVHDKDFLLVTDYYEMPLAFPMQMLVARGTAQGTINGNLG